MSQDAGWDSLWKAYMGALESWESAFGRLRDGHARDPGACGPLFGEVGAAAEGLESRLSDVWSKAESGSSAEILGAFMQRWRDAMGESFEMYGEDWQRFASNGGDAGFRRAISDWQAFLRQGDDLEKLGAYRTTMRAFADAWNSMWPKPG